MRFVMLDFGGIVDILIILENGWFGTLLLLPRFHRYWHFGKLPKRTYWSKLGYP